MIRMNARVVAERSSHSRSLSPSLFPFLCLKHLDFIYIYVCVCVCARASTRKPMCPELKRRVVAQLRYRAFFMGIYKPSSHLPIHLFAQAFSPTVSAATRASSLIASMIGRVPSPVHPPLGFGLEQQRRGGCSVETKHCARSTRAYIHRTLYSRLCSEVNT